MIQIVRVLAPNPGVYTLEGTNTWIVGAGPAIVIDPGPAGDAHLREVARLAGAVSAVLLTHDHEDHAEGAATFASLVTAPLYAVRVQGAEPLPDGRVFAAGDGARVEAVATPGHSSDHVAFLETTTRSLFTGDAVLGRGTSFIDPPGGDLTAYLASLERMRDLGARSIHPGHGPVRTDARAVLQGYLDHRVMREAQIVAALERGDGTVADLVAEIYADHPLDVRPLAERSVTAHLLKLEAEDAVERKGHGVAQTWAIAVAKACARCGKPMKGAGTYCQRCLVAMLQGSDAAQA